MGGAYGQSFSFPTVSCRSGAYAVISNSGGFAAGGSSEHENYTGCVYPYKNGTRVHFVLVSITTHAGGLQGMVNSSIKKMVGGENEDYTERNLDQVADKFVNLMPGAKLIKQSKEPATASR